GINSEMQRLADEIAIEGYAVMIPDLLSRGSWFSCMRRLMRDLKRGEGQGVDDLIEARNWLAGQTYLSEGRVAVMGLCMGGGFALLLAKSGLFRVSAQFYGKVPGNLDGACPIVASYGARDQLTLPDARRLVQEIERLNIPGDLKIYPDAGHSFMNKAPNRAMKLLGRLLPAHAAYNPEAAADATKRLIAFLQKHL
ncbi:MAG: dienelactone hydrolase family protein, partial [Pseudomonadota bacterium]